MARQAKEPWWWGQKHGWYTTINKQRIFLAKDKKEAWEEFRKLHADPTAAVRTDSVWGVFDAFLDWTQTNRAPRTYDFYLERLQRFKDAAPNMPVPELTPDHVYVWFKGKTWGANYRRGVVTALSRAFNWAVKARKIPFNPIKGIEKPSEHHREAIITPAQFKELVRRVKDDEFRDILSFIWFTGCRPFEAARMSCVHLDLKQGMVVFPRDESKGKKKPRVIHLVDKAVAICKKWAKRNPEGPIFRNRKGTPWTAFAFNNRFMDLQITEGRKLLAEENFELSEHDIEAKIEKLRPWRKDHGVKKAKSPAELRAEAILKLSTAEAMKRGTKVCMYSLRHSYAHHALTKGKLDPVTCATLLGHSNTNMLMKVYGHLLKDPKFMRDAAKRAIGS